jgi:hypothetical protein
MTFLFSQISSEVAYSDQGGGFKPLKYSVDKANTLITGSYGVAEGLPFIAA